MLVSLTVHEAAHAWTANRLGDPTARMLGRVSLNPLVHIDPIGTVLLPIVAIMTNLPILGWAKPVPVNISQLRQPRRDFMLVAAAGPVSNLLQAVVAAIAFRLIAASVGPSGPMSFTAPAIGMEVLGAAIQINVLLAIFNLVPVPPLDGGNVLAGLLPGPAAAMFMRLRPFGFLLLYALLFTGILSAIVLPPATFLTRLLVR